MFYHKQCEKVVHDVKSGAISKSEALERLKCLEAEAYKLIPGAEPDGDITYCVACAVEDIEDYEL